MMRVFGFLRVTGNPYVLTDFYLFKYIRNSRGSEWGEKLIKYLVSRYLQDILAVESIVENVVEV